MIVAEAVTVLNHRYRSAAQQVVTAADTREVVVASPRTWRRAKRALGRGHAVVRLQPGTYPASDVVLRGDTTLLGGPGVTLEAPSGSYWGVLIVEGRDIRIDGLTIDGGGSGPGLGQAVVVQPSRDVVLRKLRIRRVRNDGIYMWGNLRNVSVQDCILTSPGTADAGVVAAVADAENISVIRTRIAGFRSFGVTFSQARFDLSTSGLHNVALDNTITDIDERVNTDGRSKGGIWTGGPDARVIGNTIRRTGWDGIETVGTSTNDHIVGNTISDTPTGIYVEHSTNGSVIQENTIARTHHGINVEWRYGGVGSAMNDFSRNLITDSETAIFIDAGADNNVVARNSILRGGRPAIILQGSSGNVVRANRSCGAPGPLAAERDANVPASENRFVANRAAATCAASVASRRR